VNAPDLWMKSASAAIPFLVPRICGRTISLESFLRMWWCCANLGHSLRGFSHGQAVGLGDRGRNACLNSPV
jgi:hypothetical protein